MKRLGVAFLGAVLLLAAGPGRSRASSSGKRPNIVFILVDDLAHDAMGFVGRYPFLKTPHIDALAQRGAWFRNAFVTISLCAPSRSEFLSGRYAHETGVPTNEGYEIRSDVATFPMQLQKAGYVTAFVGKWHMAPRSDPRPGFNRWVGFKGQGVYNDPLLNVDGHNIQRDGYITDILTQYAEQFLTERMAAESAGDHRPFCLYLAHKAVHGPFTPPERDSHSLDDVALAEPPSWSDDMADKPRWMRRMSSRPGPDGKVPDRLQPWPWPAHAEARIHYLEAITAVDESVGKVVDMLRRMHELDNTIIVFTSDNGFFMGEHRHGDKRLMYEEALRIPMIIDYPGHIAPGSVNDAMVLNIDIAPTFIELGRAKLPPKVRGRSLVPLFGGKTPTDWRHEFFYEYFREVHFNSFPTLVGIRTDRYKYIDATDEPGDIAEFYDLEQDPYEMESRIADPAYAPQVTKLKADMARLQKQVDYHVPAFLADRPPDKHPWIPGRPAKPHGGH